MKAADKRLIKFHGLKFINLISESAFLEKANKIIGEAGFRNFNALQHFADAEVFSSTMLKIEHLITYENQNSGQPAKNDENCSADNKEGNPPLNDDTYFIWLKDQEAAQARSTGPNTGNYSSQIKEGNPPSQDPNPVIIPGTISGETMAQKATRVCEMVETIISGRATGKSVQTQQIRNTAITEDIKSISDKWLLYWGNFPKMYEYMQEKRLVRHNSPDYFSPEGWELEKRLAVRKIRNELTVAWFYAQGTEKHAFVANRLAHLIGRV